MTIPPKLYPLVDRWLAEHVMGWHLCKASFEYSWDSGKHIDGLIILNTKKAETWRPCTDLNDVKLCVDKLGYETQDSVATTLAKTFACFSIGYAYPCGAILNKANNLRLLSNATAEQRVIALLLALNGGKSLEEILTMIKEMYE